MDPTFDRKCNFCIGSISWKIDSFPIIDDCMTVVDDLQKYIFSMFQNFMECFISFFLAVSKRLMVVKEIIYQIVQQMYLHNCKLDSLEQCKQQLARTIF